jgi:ABC-2 type transport system permease protein
MSNSLNLSRTIMENSLDLSRWTDAPNGVGYRRWVIVSTGLRQLSRRILFRILLLIAWLAGFVMASLAFLFSQAVASGGWLETSAAHLGPRFEAIASALGGLILLYPDICIHGLFTTIFWLQSFVGLGLSLLAITLIVPRLIARDRSSNALTIYLSRPLTSADYLLGKLGMIAGVIILVWTGPLVCGWLVSVVLAPNRDFIVYSFSPLLRALLFNGVALAVLASIALGVSALTRSSRATTILWMGLWVVAGALGSWPHSPEWLRRTSFSHDLGEARQTIFKLDEALSKAGTKLPFLDRNFTQTLNSAGRKAEATDFAGAAGSLAVMVVLSSAVFLRKLRAE